ncbi:MAG TPA: hypothetical protein VMV27_03130 [Candidatus Binataceae bacterium]|nr:hypothetical protein [Candidatus Binataceae bacterium]
MAVASILRSSSSIEVVGTGVAGRAVARAPGKPPALASAGGADARAGVTGVTG